MFLFINIFYIVFLHFIIKFFFNYNKTSFKKIFILYLFFYLVLVLVFNLNIINFQNNELNSVYLILNFFIFLSYILTIGLKKINSPTFYILEYFKQKNITNKFELIANLKEKNIFKQRFTELNNEKMIIITNNEIALTKNGRTFARFMKFLSIFFKVKSKG